MTPRGGADYAGVWLTPLQLLAILLLRRLVQLGRAVQRPHAFEPKRLGHTLGGKPSRRTLARPAKARRQPQ